MKKILQIVVPFLIAFSISAEAQELKSPVHLRLASQDLGSA